MKAPGESAGINSEKTSFSNQGSIITFHSSSFFCSLSVRVSILSSRTDPGSMWGQGKRENIEFAPPSTLACVNVNMGRWRATNFPLFLPSSSSFSYSGGGVPFDPRSPPLFHPSPIPGIPQTEIIASWGVYTHRHTAAFQILRGTGMPSNFPL